MEFFVDGIVNLGEIEMNVTDGRGGSRWAGGRSEWVGSKDMRYRMCKLPTGVRLGTWVGYTGRPPVHT